MKEHILATITDADLFEGAAVPSTLSKKRTAARAIIFKDNKIAILHVTKYAYHKLPGGGVEGVETIEQALQRECAEECGCSVAIGEYIGTIIERKQKHDEEQTSHTFMTLYNEVKTQAFTKNEAREGFELKWMTLGAAITTLSNDIPANYEGRFIVARDLRFLQEARERLENI